MREAALTTARATSSRYRRRRRPWSPGRSTEPTHDTERDRAGERRTGGRATRCRNRSACARVPPRHTLSGRSAHRKPLPAPSPESRAVPRGARLDSMVPFRPGPPARESSGVTTGFDFSASDPAEARRAFEQQQYSITYQPIVDLTTGRVLAQEALARSHSPTFPSIVALLKALEPCGLVGELGRNLRRLATKGCPQPLSLNVSPLEFAEGWLVRPDDPIFLHREASTSRSPRPRRSHTSSSARASSTRCAAAACTSWSTTSARATRTSATSPICDPICEARSRARRGTEAARVKLVLQSIVG